MARADDKAPLIGTHGRHCFKGVESEIEKHLQQLHAIRQYLAAIQVNFGYYRRLSSQSLGADNPKEILIVSLIWKRER